jgi:hypothetical protein
MKRVLASVVLAAVAAACGIGPHDDRPSEVKAAAAKAPAVKSDASGDAQRRADYLSKIEVTKVTAHKGTGAFNKPIGVVNGEVKNTGDSSLDEVQVTIYFLDASGKAVHEDTYHPVLVGGFGDHSPLKPNYALKFADVKFSSSK